MKTQASNQMHHNHNVILWTGIFWKLLKSAKIAEVHINILAFSKREKNFVKPKGRPPFLKQSYQIGQLQSNISSIWRFHEFFVYLLQRPFNNTFFVNRKKTYHGRCLTDSQTPEQYMKIRIINSYATLMLHKDSGKQT